MLQNLAIRAKLIASLVTLSLVEFFIGVGGYTSLVCNLHCFLEYEKTIVRWHF